MVFILNTVRNKFNPNYKIWLIGIGFLITGLSAVGINWCLSIEPNGNIAAFAMCLGVFFFGIQIIYDGIKSILKIN